MIDLAELSTMSQDAITARAKSDPAWLDEMENGLRDIATTDRQATQLAYYTVANPNAMNVHLSTAKEIALVGGNRSSKTDTMLAELSIRMTGHIPMALQNAYPCLLYTSPSPRD